MTAGSFRPVGLHIVSFVRRGHDRQAAPAVRIFRSVVLARTSVCPFGDWAEEARIAVGESPEGCFCELRNFSQLHSRTLAPSVLSVQPFKIISNSCLKIERSGLAGTGSVRSSAQFAGRTLGASVALPPDFSMLHL